MMILQRFTKELGSRGTRRGVGRSAWVCTGLFALSALCGLGLDAASGQERPGALAGALTGKVVDAATGQGLGDVEIRVVGTDMAAVTDDRGSFRIDPIRAGTHRVRFSRIGYTERTEAIEIAMGAVLAVTASLAEDPVELPPLIVTVRSAVLDQAGFYDRREQGMRGYFLERSDIEDRRPDTVTDLFRRMNGIRVIHGGIYGSQVLVNQRVTFTDSSAGCQPSIWLDGIRSTMATPDLMQVEELEGIEVYTSASAPGRFNDVCGVIVMWTRQRRATG